jgi:hypothetical protein
MPIPNKKQNKITKCIEYKKNDIVLYINSDKTISQVKIIDVHYNTYPDIYYTIEFEDGKQKQTIQGRLFN